MKILVPIDGSNASFAAAKKAAEIVREYGFAVKLITVADVSSARKSNRNENFWRQVDGSMSTGADKRLDDDEKIIKIKEKAEEILHKFIGKLDFGKVVPKSEVLYGEPHEAILEIAERERVDLIIMGNRGLSPFKRFYVGSVSQKVISESKCPVLVVREEENQ